MKTTTFTSTISPQLLSWVTEHAKATQKTRRDILETALEKYKIEEIKRGMREDFKRASKDPDVLEMTEWGMDDYYNIVTS